MGNWKVLKLHGEKKQKKKRTQRKGEETLGTKTKRRGMMGKKQEEKKVTHDMKQKAGSQITRAFFFYVSIKKAPLQSHTGGREENIGWS